MELINENDLQNVCGGGKVLKGIQTASKACILASAVGLIALAIYDGVKNPTPRKTVTVKEEEIIIEQWEVKHEIN